MSVLHIYICTHTYLYIYVYIYGLYKDVPGQGQMGFLARGIPGREFENSSVGPKLAHKHLISKPAKKPCMKPT